MHRYWLLKQVERTVTTGLLKVNELWTKVNEAAENKTMRFFASKTHKL